MIEYYARAVRVGGSSMAQEVKPAPSAGQSCAADIAALLRARNPLVWLVTREEARAERIIIDAAAAAGYGVVAWDCASGLVNPIDGAARDARLADPGQALAAVRDSSRREVWIMRDLPAFLKDPFVGRALRSLCRSLPMAARGEARAVVVISPSGDVPPELAGHAIVLDVPLPDRAELAAILDSAIEALPDELKAGAPVNGQREAAIDACLGLSAEEAQSSIARSLIQSRKVDPSILSKEKRRVISRERVLEWIDPNPAGMAAVGGLEVLKGWLSARRVALSPQARAYGLPAPKGMLLVGIPGTGKSLVAKCVATAWGMPLLRLDLGALKSKWVGESEGNIRRALKVAETVAPCVVWLDEIEKALAGATQGAADGGTSADALGTILSWMQDRAGSVFVVATANDVSALPPELLRKGRFDELFFTDLPTHSERCAIVRAALAQYGRAFDGIDIPRIATAADGFVGAEISALVPAAMFAAFNDGARAITTADVLAEAAATVPLSRTAADKVTALRQWAQGRARSASAPESTPGKPAARALDI